MTKLHFLKPNTGHALRVPTLPFLTDDTVNGHGERSVSTEKESMNVSEQHCRVIAELCNHAQPGGGCVFRFILSMIGDKDKARDLTQDVFVAAQQALPTLRKSESLRSFVLKIARHKCYALFRSSSRARLIFGYDYDQTPIASNQPIESPRAEALRECIEQLNDDERRNLYLRYDQDQPPAIIATIRKQEVGTIRRQLHRSRAKIMACIQRKLGSNRE